MKNICKKYKINNHEFKIFSKSFISSLSENKLIENLGPEVKNYINALKDLLENGDIKNENIKSDNYRILILNSGNNNIILNINSNDFSKASTLAAVMSSEYSNKDISKELCKLYDCYETSMMSINTN